MRKLWIDLETYSPVPIEHGAYRYAEDAEILLYSYGIDNGPAQVWDCTDGSMMPNDLADALWDDDCQIIGHNIGGFDAVVLRATGQPIRTARLWDSMACAMAHSLPASLAVLGEALELSPDAKKHTGGSALIRLFCIPRPKNHKLRRATRDTHPAEWAQFVEYARGDVIALREIYRKLPKWNYKGGELALWHLDQTINMRGVAVDTDLAKAAIRAVAQARTDLATEAADVSDGAIASTSQVAATLAVLASWGVDLPDLRGSTVEEYLDNQRGRQGEIPEPVRIILENRLQASKSSSAKYKRLIDATNTDGRLRGLLQFCGAGRTGRWAGRIVQPQNLPRPTLGQADIDMGIALMKLDAADLVFDNVMELASSALRGAIVAPPGKKLVVADLSNIEGRVLAWLADEFWKVKAFEEFDAGTGHDLYKLAYAKSFGVEPGDVTKDQRQVGKVMELALGYGGGVGAFLTFATAYAIDLEALADQAYDTIPASILAASGEAYRRASTTFDLSEKAWIVCDAFKRLWRDGHPAISRFWGELEGAVRLCIKTKEAVVCRSLVVDIVGEWLRIKLPSGRYLCYPNARIDEDGSISYAGIDQFSRKPAILRTYGGKLVENVTQAVARDVLASSMAPIEKAGYQIVLTVHDEIISEASPDHTVEGLARLMSTAPKWAKGLPLAAAGFETTRYRKD